MKTLIAYYSFTGNNEALARKIHQRLQCDILRIEEERKRRNISILLDLVFNRTSRLKKYDFHISSYETVILMAPIWAGKIGTPLRSFLAQENNNIKNYSFITLCSGVADQKEKIIRSLTSVMNNTAVAVEELWINDLLPREQKDNIKYTTPYRIKEADWKNFDAKIDAFLKSLDAIGR
jgi:Flavodoxins